MLRRFKRYLYKKNMILSTEKSKVLVFEDGRGRKEKREWKWDEKSIEEVKEIKYLDYCIYNITEKRRSGKADNEKIQESNNRDEEDVESKRR